MSSTCIRLVKRYLCVKKLTIHDGFTAKSVKLPRAEARFFMGELRNRQATPVVLLDEEGKCWELLCTCTGAQYALSRIGAFCEAHGAMPGHYFIFYADHEHIVRLAVRKELPEDVQAIVAAARAAAAIRCSPSSPQPASQQSQPPAQPQPGDQLPAQSRPQQQQVERVACPLDDPRRRTLEDVPGPDEVLLLDVVPPSLPPAASTVEGSTGAPQAGSGVAALQAPARTGPRASLQEQQEQSAVRVLPLQDRSNLPQAAVLTEAAKAKPLGARTGDQQPAACPGATAATAVATAQPSSRRPDSLDKENKENAPAGVPNGQPSGKVSASATTCTEGLSPPAPNSNPSPGSNSRDHARSPSQARKQQHHQQHPQAGPRTPPPPSASPSPQAASSPSAQPQPSPATRLRLRFEARLRAQAGKLHPLSVRTGPCDPAPSAGNCNGSSFGVVWPTTLAGPYSTVGSSHLHVQWGVGGGWQGQQHVASGYPLGSSSGGPSAGSQPDSSAGLGAGQSYPQRGCAASGASGANCTGSEAAGGLARGAAPHPPTAPPSAGESWRQQLQCDELLDWELGRRAVAGGPAVAQGRLGLAALLPSQSHPPGCSPREPSNTPTSNLSFLRQLLLRNQTGNSATQSPSAWQAATSAAAASGVAAAGSGPDPSPGPSQSGQRPKGGVLMSLAAANSTLRQLLGGQARPAAGSSAAAWERAASTSRGASPAWAQGGQQGSAADAAGPSGQGLSPSRDSDAAWEERGCEVFGARAKSSLSVSRNGLGPPADWPDSKRPRPGPQPEPRSCAAVASRASGQVQESCPTGFGTSSGGCADTCDLPQVNPRARWGPLLATKALTTGDLLSDRVAVQAEKAALASALAPLGIGIPVGPATRPDLAGPGLVGPRLAAPDAGERRGLAVLLGPGLAGSGPAAPRAPSASQQEAQVEAETEPMEIDSGPGVSVLFDRTQRMHGELGSDVVPPGRAVEGDRLPGHDGRVEVPVEVMVESGALYEGAMVLGSAAPGEASRGGGKPDPCGTTGLHAHAVCEVEVRGLRPYLIRRQAGVGDVLRLWAEGGESSAARLRLHAVLLQPHLQP